MMALVAHVQNGVKAVASCIVRVVVSILSIVIERICRFVLCGLLLCMSPKLIRP